MGLCSELRLALPYNQVTTKTIRRHVLKCNVVLIETYKTVLSENHRCYYVISGYHSNELLRER
jgi:hypothetical protein